MWSKNCEIKSYGSLEETEITRGTSYNPQTLTGISFDISWSFNLEDGRAHLERWHLLLRSWTFLASQSQEFKEWIQQKLKSMLPGKVNWQKQYPKPWNVAAFWFHLLNCHTVSQNYTGKEILGNVIWIKVGWRSKMPCSGLLWTIS